MVHKFYHLITKIACLDEAGSGLPPAKLLSTSCGMLMCVSLNTRT